MDCSLKYGVVSETKPGFVKVHFEEDLIVSEWLPVLVRRSKTQKESWQLEINEHVVCLMDCLCEQGVCIGAIHNDEDAPDPGEAKGKFRKLFSDGTLIEYDLQAAKMKVDIKGELEAETTGPAKINAGTSLEAKSGTSALIDAGTTLDAKAGVKATVEAVQIELKGIVTVTGAMIVTGNVSVAGSLGAAGIAATGGTQITATGNIITTGEILAQDIKAGVVSLLAHKHTAPNGGGITSPPIP